ncbi:uncharacterized protein PAC_01064 [Phialocephala subalpina]|uniref:Uncharacterized protein n=1 Tax=Phialocephala subalpina TaxID=576137 RepID=A0A1L7WEN9_9HELO|nr:uncharacterized protein PAC_01064 [Phialocephala subalpina]
MSVPSTENSLTKVEEEVIVRAYVQLPTPPDGSGEDIGLDVNPHLPPSPLATGCSVCGPEIDDDLPPLPDSPKRLAKFGIMSIESFNTSVRGLVQEEPDSPIGGYPAAPLADQLSLDGIAPLDTGNLDGQRYSDIQLQDLPRLEITSPQSGPCCSTANVQERQCLVSRSRFSDPLAISLEKKQYIRRPITPLDPLDCSVDEDSGYTTIMVTARESPIRPDNTDMSHDGPRESYVENIDPRAPLPDCCMSPRSHTSLSEGIMVYDLNGPPRAFRGSNCEKSNGVFEPCETTIGAKRLKDSYVHGTGVVGEPLPLVAPRGRKVTVPDTQIHFVGTTDGPGPANGIAKVPAPPGLSTDIVPRSAVPAGVPTDATGRLPVPNPPRIGRGKRLRNKGSSFMRRGRRIVLRKPVLVIILGRQLAPPVKEAIKLISNGVDVAPDVQGLTEAAGIKASKAPAPPTAPAPVPM